MELERRIIEFVDSGALRIGYVREVQHRKVKVIDQRGREATVPNSRVVVVHDAAASEEDFALRVSEILSSIERHMDEIDPELLWESVCSMDRAFGVDELASHYFGRSAPELTSAVFRLLEKESLFFRRKGSQFRPRAREQVASEKLRRERESEREAFRQHVHQLLRQALDGGSIEDDPDWIVILDRLERWFRQSEKDVVGMVFEEIVGSHHAREAAFDLLARFNRIAATEDRFLLTRGFPIEFPPDVVDAAAGVGGVRGPERRQDWSTHEALAIDDMETIEIDDALSVMESADSLVVGIHIADVAGFSVKGDLLDREARRRGATIYLPNTMVPMFPLQLSAEDASLLPGVRRPAFTVEARFDSECSLSGFTVHRTWIRVSERLTYEGADQHLAEGKWILTRLRDVALQLRSQRTAQGAQTHHRPEIKVRVRDGRVEVHRHEVDTPSRLIVSEMMILANQLAADHAALEGIPIIYRTQEAPEGAMPETEGLPEALQFELLRKSFKRSRLSLSPAPHAGLGLEAYTQVSSPIRRYADLVTQRQFVAAMQGEAFPYDRDELLKIITAAEAKEAEIRRLEQASTTYWLLTHLAQEKMRKPLQGIVLDRKGTVELTDYLIRGRVPASEEWEKGETVTVEIESIRPRSGEITLRACV